MKWENPDTYCDIAGGTPVGRRWLAASPHLVLRHQRISTCAGDSHRESDAIWDISNNDNRMTEH